MIIMIVMLLKISAAEEVRLNQSCLSKMTGYYWDGQQCLKCRSPQCVCSEYQGCSDCIDNFYLLDGDCMVCPLGCVQCCQLHQLTQIVCTLCDTDYYNLNGVCYKIEGCQRFSRHGRCSSCKSGYYLEDTCKKCPTGCEECDSASYCTSCLSGSFPIILGDQYICQSCDYEDKVGCAVCDSDYTCYSCLDGYFYSEETFECTKCQSNCKSCQNPAIKPPVCYGCEDNYILNENAADCISCQDLISDCLWCSKVLLDGLESYKCGNCQNGFFMEDDQCIDCKTIDINARRCDSRNLITQCQPGYLLYLDNATYKCIKNQNNCRKIDSASGSCQQCLVPQQLMQSGDSLKCQDCSILLPNCLECSFADGKQFCTTCAEQYYNNNGACEVCQLNCLSCDNNSCIECENGFALQGNTCVPCEIENCDICSHIDVCTKCLDEYGVVEGQCMVCLVGCKTCNIDQTLCQECLQDYFLSNSVCLPYPPHCLKATLSGFCYLCQTLIFNVNEIKTDFVDENNEETISDEIVIPHNSIFYKSTNGYCVLCSDYATGSFTCPNECSYIEEVSGIKLFIGVMSIFIMII